MGKWEERIDARARADFKEAFICSLEILNRKGSKRLMAQEIEGCCDDLAALGKYHELPENFRQFSVYGQRDILNKVVL
ncbi:MAG: hypothetical protein V2A69_10600 [Pseudomonadota bacterium]